MPNEFTASKEDLPGLYLDCLKQNPLLARIEGSLRSLGWTDEQIRTFQLLTACKSNASLLDHARMLERRIAVVKPV